MLEPEVSEYLVQGDVEAVPLLTFPVEAQRNTRYYVLTMFLPMAFIVFMSWSAFWLQPEAIPPRIGIATASIFSMIALGVSIRLGLPRISYLTRSDLFSIGCTAMVFLALAVAVVVSRWSKDRMEHALRLNAMARWLYVVLFSLVAIVALAV